MCRARSGAAASCWRYPGREPWDRWPPPRARTMHWASPGTFSAVSAAGARARRRSHAGFFSAYLHGHKHSDLRFHLKPRGALNQLSTPEEVALINVDPGDAQEGIWYLDRKSVV